VSNARRNVAPIFQKARPLQGRKYSIIIPAAGEGVRMKSYGPKPLIKITPNRTIIQHQLDIIAGMFGKYEVILVAGYEACRVMNQMPPDVVCVENEMYAETNVLRSIGMGLRAATTDSVLIVYGDLVFNTEALQYKFKDESTVIIAPSTMTDNEVGCTISNDGIIENVMYDLPNKWAQIAYFTGRELQLLKNIAWAEGKEKLFGFEALNFIIEHGGKLHAVMPTGIKVNDMDSSKDLKTVKGIL